jgi:hypothetical protein
VLSNKIELPHKQNGSGGGLEASNLTFWFAKREHLPTVYVSKLLASMSARLFVFVDFYRLVLQLVPSKRHVDRVPCYAELNNTQLTVFQQPSIMEGRACGNFIAFFSPLSVKTCGLFLLSLLLSSA